MKRFITSLSLFLIISTLTACNSENEQQTTESTISQDTLPNTKELQQNIEQNIASDPKPLTPVNLDDLRSAIDDVVQDSIQEEVEKAVEDEVAKKSKE